MHGPRDPPKILHMSQLLEMSYGPLMEHQWIAVGKVSGQRRSHVRLLSTGGPSVTRRTFPAAGPALPILSWAGSMRGDPILLARRALALFLRSLPTTCIFNIISFGSRFNKLFPASVPYNQPNLNTATNYANCLAANYGSTFLCPPMRDIYGSSPGYLTQVFVLTDGNNHEGTPAITNMLRANKTFARVFSLGIGSRVSPSLINGIAAEGGGVPEFVRSDEKVKQKFWTS